MFLKLISLLFFQICLIQAFSQYVLDTPDGKKVKLNANGTWIYLRTDNVQELEKQVPSTSTAKYISHSRKFEFWYDPAQWTVDTVKKTNTYTWDAYFYSTDFAIQGYCLDSRLSMPFESVEESIKEQWRTVGEINSFNHFKDTINNLPVTIFELEYVQAAITYLYKGIIYSGARGSFQFTVGTQKEIFEEDKDKIDLLLLGLIKK